MKIHTEIVISARQAHQAHAALLKQAMLKLRPNLALPKLRRTTRIADPFFFASM